MIISEAATKTQPATAAVVVVSGRKAKMGQPARFRERFWTLTWVQYTGPSFGVARERATPLPQDDK